MIGRLQDDYIKVQNDLARVHDNKVESSEQLQELVHKLQAQLASKAREVNLTHDYVYLFHALYYFVDSFLFLVGYKLLHLNTKRIFCDKFKAF